MRSRSRSDQLARLAGAVGLVLVAFTVAGPSLTGATLTSSTGLSSAPITAGTWNAYPAAVAATTPPGRTTRFISRAVASASLTKCSTSCASAASNCRS